MERYVKLLQGLGALTTKGKYRMYERFIQVNLCITPIWGKIIDIPLNTRKYLFN